MCEIAQMTLPIADTLGGPAMHEEHTMGILSFVKDAGEKLFHTGQNADATPAASGAPASGGADVASLNQTAANAILNYIRTQNLPVENLNVSYDGSNATATVSGQAQDQATKEKVILACGNIHSVAHVDDQLTVSQPAPEAKFYTVKSGDTLSKISKEMYGDANKYNAIFEANRPMLTSPDKIYPGQMLRIPAQA
jgi:nucleoid-associated protein YgaU